MTVRASIAANLIDPAPVVLIKRRNYLVRILSLVPLRRELTNVGYDFMADLKFNQLFEVFIKHLSDLNILRTADLIHSLLGYTLT